MPFFGNEYNAAVEGYPDAVDVAYRRAMWHNWSALKCAGLPDDSEYLRKVCRRDKDEWLEIYPILFSESGFFSLGEDGKWHQKRQDEEWAKSKLKYDRAVLGGRNRAASMSRQQRVESASKASKMRWKHD